MKKYYVISHTHWDREWYQPLEVMKIRLASLIDNLFELIEKDGSYVFHLDEQTIVLEDYLSLKPENEEKLKKYISSGNIVVGPWYLQNDFYYSSGEATVRNLQYGLELAEKFGRVNRAGYAPDNFGLISQLPQILNNFGIDTLLFGRGYDRWNYGEDGSEVLHHRPSEFIWKGADGSKLYSSYMKGWYNNAQRFPKDLDKSQTLVSLSEEIFDGFNKSPYLLLMNGVDHLEAQDDIKEIIDKLNERYGEKVFEQTTIEQYLCDLRDFLQKSQDVSVYCGEMKEGKPFQILRHCASSRIYLKRLNAIMQNFLEYQLEPTYSMIGVLGGDCLVEKGFFDYFWKNQLKQLPHDNICGCSTDSVNRHMEDLFERNAEGMNKYYQDGLQFICEHLPAEKESEDKYKLIAINPLNHARNAIVYATVDLPVDENITSFYIEDASGKRLEYEILSKHRVWKDVISPLNAPYAIDSYRYSIVFDGGQVEPFAVKSFVVGKGKGRVCKAKKSDSITNGKITISQNGNSIKLVCEDRVIENLFGFEDDFDSGDAYRFKNDAKEKYNLKYSLTKCSFKQSNVRGVASIKYDIFIPASLDYDTHERSKVLVKTSLCMELILEKGSDTVKLNYNFTNKCKNHRLRIIFNTDCTASGFTVDTPFDIMYYDKSNNCPLEKSNTQSNTSFACVESGENGFAVFTQGQHEVEHVENKLIFTLVRSTQAIYGDEKGRVAGGTLWGVPENQCLREITGSFGINLYSGGLLDAEIPHKSLAFRNAFNAYFDSCDKKKFHGGAFFSQNKDLNQLYYPKDRCPNLTVPENQSIVNLSGKNIAVSCFKKAKDGDGYIIRGYNLSNNTTKATVKFNGKIFLTDMEEKSNAYLGEGEVSFDFEPKKIITFRLKR